MNDNLVEGFNKAEEKEEMRRYGIKKKQKKKTRINLVISLILGISLFFLVIWIFYLKNQITQKDNKINILKNHNKNLTNSLNEGKMEIDRLTAQYQNVQNKAFTLLEKCFNNTSSLKFQIMDLQKEAAENEKNKMKEIVIPQRNIPQPRRRDFPCNIF